MSCYRFASRRSKAGSLSTLQPHNYQVNELDTSAGLDFSNPGHKQPSAKATNCCVAPNDNNLSTGLFHIRCEHVRSYVRTTSHTGQRRAIVAGYKTIMSIPRHRGKKQDSGSAPGGGDILQLSRVVQGIFVVACDATPNVLQRNA